VNLKVLTPEQVVVDEEAVKVIAEAKDGAFCLLPRHADFATALVPGLLEVHGTDGREQFFAIDEGILVKAGPDVLVSTRRAVPGDSLDTLHETVEKQFEVRDEREQQARGAAARLEADLVRRFVELEK